MTDGIAQTIDSIFGHLTRLRRSIASRRCPGISTTAVHAKLSAAGLSVSPDLVEVYNVCSGTDTAEGDVLDEIHFFPGYYWMSIDDSTVTYHINAENSEWRKTWFPLFANGGGDFYAIICDEESSDFGGIVGFLLGESFHLVEFQNLTAMLKVIDRSFDDEAFYLADGYLEADYPRMREISQALQPGFIEHEV